MSKIEIHYWSTSTQSVILYRVNRLRLDRHRIVRHSTCLYGCDLQTHYILRGLSFRIRNSVKQLVYFYGADEIVLGQAADSVRGVVHVAMTVADFEVGVMAFTVS